MKWRKCRRKKFGVGVVDCAAYTPLCFETAMFSDTHTNHLLLTACFKANVRKKFRAIKIRQRPKITNF